jgi:hypothetical protein
MFVARWQIDARFGHKQTVIDLLRKWEREVGTKAGTDRMDFKILTGSIGAREATVEANHAVESMAQLEQFFTAIGNNEAHRQWAKTSNPMWFPVQRSGAFIAPCEATADALKVRGAGAMTWPPDGVTRKTASPR